jgi:hypothetical protein
MLSSNLRRTTRRWLSSTSATTLNNKADVNKIGRVIFSGIQPTGVPHVSSSLLTRCLGTTTWALLARQLPWGSLKLGYAPTPF